MDRKDFNLPLDIFIKVELDVSLIYYEDIDEELIPVLESLLILFNKGYITIKRRISGLYDKVVLCLTSDSYSDTLITSVNIICVDFNSIIKIVKSNEYYKFSEVSYSINYYKLTTFSIKDVIQYLSDLKSKIVFER